MKTLSIRSRFFASLAIGALSLIPVVGLAQANGHDQGRGSNHQSQTPRSSGRSQGSTRGNTGSSNRSTGTSTYTGQGRSYSGNSGSQGQAPARSARGNQSGNFGNGNSSAFGSSNGRNSQRTQNRDFGSGGQSAGSRGRGADSRGFNSGRNRDQGFSQGRGGLSIGIGIGGYGGYAGYGNEWSDIAQLSGGVAYLGDLNGDDTLFFAGSAGALYPIYQYDEDRNCDDPVLRLRAAYFSRPYFYRDGQRFNRALVNQRGERYYQFRRG